MNAIGRLNKQQILILLAIVVLVGELFANLVNVGDEGGETENGGVGAFLGLSAFGIAVGAAVIYGLVGRVAETSRLGLILAVVALITVAVFWSALPFAFGVPALWLGVRALGAGRGDGMPTVVIATVAIVAALVLCIVG